MFGLTLKEKWKEYQDSELDYEHKRPYRKYEDKQCVTCSDRCVPCLPKCMRHSCLDEEADTV